MQISVERVISSLVDSQVEFIIVGGVSAVLHGAPVVTQDLDICYHRTPQNVARLAAALRHFNPRLRGIPPGLPDMVDEHTLRLGTKLQLFLDVLRRRHLASGVHALLTSTTRTASRRPR